MIKNDKKVDWSRYEEEKQQIADSALTADEYEKSVKELARKGGY